MRRAASALLLAALLIPPLTVRSTLLVEGGFAPALPDALGLLSDLAVALLAFSLVRVVARGQRATAVALVALWALLQYAGYEHVRELGAGLQFEYAAYLADPTFLAGSALAPGRPGLLIALVLGAPLLAAVALRGGAAAPRALPALAGGLVLLALVSAAPRDPARLAWRQRHFVHENLERGLRRASVLAAETDAVRAVFRPDLGGQPWLPLPQPRRNVLLVIFEGLSGAFVEPIATANGFTSELSMPQLSALARQHVAAANFVLQQRQTNRGVYALLCGDLPKLGTALARMTEYAQTGGRACLPALLRAAGYRTAYLQSAPLSFMFKDRFMARAGFEEIEGEHAFGQALVHGPWGVDDRTLFRRALERMRSFASEDRPWFVALLTVGTHHPFTIPDELQQESRDAGFSAAVGYADAALGELIDGMRAAGLLENTLVLITSDESSGLHQAADDVTRRLSQSWGPLVLIEPTGQRRLLTEPIGQSDVALSIADYLGLDAADGPFIGRSLFRSYPQPRPLFFANTYQRRVGALAGPDLVYLCDEQRLDECEKYRAASPGRFGPERMPLPLAPGELEERHGVVARSLRSAVASSHQAYDLIAEPRVRLTGALDQKIVAGSYLHVPAGSRIEVEFDVTLEGRGRPLRLLHLLNDPKRVYARRVTRRLQPGQRLALAYAYDTLESIEGLQAILLVHDAGGQGLTLRVDRAHLAFRPIPLAERPRTSGIVEHTPAGAPSARAR